MKTQILSRFLVSSALLVSLVGCSDSTQFTEKTLPSTSLDAEKPVDSTNPASSTVATDPSTDGITTASVPNESPGNAGGTDTGVGGTGTAGTGSGGTGTGTGTGSGGTGTGTGTTGGGTGGSGTTPIFSECTTHQNLTIVSQLYQLPPNTNHLPDFSKMNPIGDVCVDQLSIADRDFSQGFPGVSDIFEWFALDMRFKIMVTTPGTYTFSINSDDGSILSIDITVVVNNDGTHSQLEKSGTIYLGAGFHDVQVRYYQGPRTRIALELFWKVPGSTTKVYVPKSVMYRP